jgi:hypothetical protein
MKLVLGMVIYVLAAVLSGWRFAYVFYEDVPIKLSDGTMMQPATVNKWLRRFAYLCGACWPIAWGVWLVARLVGLSLYAIRLISPKTIERLKNETLKDFNVEDRD